MHPRPQTLQAYRDGELSPRAAARVSRHLHSCPRCQTQSELAAWQIKRLLAGMDHSSAAGPDDAHREQFLAAVLSLRSGHPQITRSLLGILVGRRAAFRAAAGSAPWTRLSPLTLMIVSSTILYLACGLAAWEAWQITGDPRWVRMFFLAAGDFFLVQLTAAAVYLSLRVWKGFDPDEPLYSGWFLILASSASGLGGSIFSKLLANHANPLSPYIDSGVLRDFRTFLGGPVAMLLLGWGFTIILRAYHHAGILNWRFRPRDWMLIAPVSLYLLFSYRQVAAAIHSGAFSTARDFILAAADPMLLVLLIGALAMRNSVRSLGGDYSTLSSSAFVSAICFSSLANMLQWSNVYHYLPAQIAPIGWYVWFISRSSLALAAAFQLDAMTETADYRSKSHVAGPAMLR